MHHSIAVCCDGHTIRRWEADALLELQASGHVKLNCFFEGLPASGPPPTRAERRLEASCTRRPEMERLKIADVFRKIPLHAGGAEQGPAWQNPPDLVWCLGDTRVPEVLPRIPLGVVRLQTAGNYRLDRQLSLSPVLVPGITHLVLTRLTADGTTEVLREARLATVFHSVARNNVQVVGSCCHLLRSFLDQPEATVADMLEFGEDSLARFTEWHALQLAWRTMVARVNLVIRNVFRADKWNVGTATLRHEDLLHIKILPGIDWFRPPSGYDYYADPFIAETEEGPLVMLEHFHDRTQTGDIACTGMDGGNPRTVLTGPGHFSYPQVFRHDGSWWCVPESNDHDNVALYRFNPGVPALRQAHVLLSAFDGVDNTLHRHEGHWWMWSTRKLGKEAGTHLYLHHAEHLEGPWHPHKQNPVKIDIGSSRPAGPLFEIEGRLYRPAQDNTDTYGGGVVIQEVMELSPDRYAEKTVNRIGPSPGSYGKGFHTVSISGSRAVVDGKRSITVFRAGKLMELLRAGK